MANRKIEISCSKKQKERMIETFECMALPCLFPKKAETCSILGENSCRKCLEENIRWNIR